MKLFLASSCDKTLHLLSGLAGINPTETKVACIANAADPYTGDEQLGDKAWVESDRKKFQELGYIVSDVDLEKQSADSFEGAMADFDIIHVCGGSTLYLMHLLQRKGLKELFKKSIVSQDRIYTGSSAGSMIAAPSVEIEKYSEESDPKIIAELKDFNGLGLVDFLIMPHANNKDFKDDFVNCANHLPEYKDPMIFLYDDHAVWVEDKNIKILHA